MSRRVGVIGAGRIGRVVLDHLAASPRYDLAAVLRRSASTAPGAWPLAPTLDAFLAAAPDLILDLAAPAALAAYGPAALARADVWTVNAAALTDAVLYEALWRAGEAGGHRLRLLPGAIAGLDGVATAFADPDATLRVTAERPGIPGGPGLLYRGSVREGACRLPGETNVAAAAAFAGPGLDRGLLEIVSSPANGRHRLALVAEGRYGRFAAEAELRPEAIGAHHPVAACVIAALERETRTIWAG